MVSMLNQSALLASLGYRAVFFEGRRPVVESRRHTRCQTCRIRGRKKFAVAWKTPLQRSVTVGHQKAATDQHIEDTRI